MDPTLGEVVSTLLLEVSEPSLQGGERVSPHPAEEASLEPGALRFETAFGEFSSEQQVGGFGCPGSSISLLFTSGRFHPLLRLDLLRC